MQKTATLNLRVNPEVKASAESVLSQLGLPMSTAVDLFLRQVSLTGGLPFSVTLPEAPASVDVSAMTDSELRATFSRGLDQIAQGKGLDARDALTSFREENYGRNV